MTNRKIIFLRPLLFATILLLLPALIRLVPINALAGENKSPLPPSVSLTPAEQDWLAAHPVIRLAPDPEFAPIEYFDRAGTYQGVAADMIRLLELKLGISFTIIRAADWDEVMVQFKNHEIDALGAIVPTPNRKTFMRISEPLLQVPGAIMVRKNVDAQLTFPALRELKVAVVSNYTAHDIMQKEYPEIELDVVKTTTAGLTKVSFGMVDAFVENLATATYYLQEAAISNVHVAGDTPFTYQWGIGIRQDWGELESIINKGIAAISQEERRAILERWLPTRQQWQPNKKQLAAFLTVMALLCVAAVFLWNLSLRRKVAQRTEALNKIIDEHQQAEEEIRLLNTNLEQRVHERTAELEKEITERIRSEQERMELEERLRQAQKMESIGTLAGGIAHDFNNILTAIFGYAEMAIIDAENSNKLKADLDGILHGANRARDLVRQILTFSRKTAQELKPLRIQSVAKEVLKLLRSTIPSTIAINQHIDTDCEPVLADPTQIHQVMMNLCTNAYHAMRNFPGELSVSVLPVVLTPTELASRIPLAPGRYVKLEVSDTGSGMSRAVSERIFEPYFTTKEKSEGTGLGLAVVHGIIKSLQGHIEVESEPGKGTTFRVYLKTVRAAEEINVQERQSLPTGSERILFIDDDEAIAELQKKNLESLGYGVTSLIDSAEALAAFQNSPDDFDLLITDMTMPKMTGDELAGRILALRPDMPIILCTGFSERIDEKKAKLLGISEFIMKPIARTTLAVVIRKVLDEKKGPR
ncbi:MAG: transporter substrate-binding domain-containing protein [Deltaproteobacteria bacterium]|nr:transporter substrate-binding domain-containing protein [Deltaproteobacteria bacterium]